ncbi:MULTISPECIES: hypothetical protein [Frankia]|uniref:Uncharacterized protein n=1 Tax=Frankia alni (strain DSM 45986 / CECT 9034 / ACN14a) TaxID=326424 RepID=Q0RJS4_FRAAA|nr:MULTISPECIES: hypothetical protein [Frankia]CAJ62237.1 hypothetical protein FRAAL3594 [Frankia alni ACN14a]
MSTDSRRPSDTASRVSAGWRDQARHGGVRGPLDDDVLAARTERERVDAGVEDRPEPAAAVTDTPPRADADQDGGRHRDEPRR